MISTLTLAQRARNSHRAPRYSICLIHPFDPRGEKVGGLETYIRDFITFHPADTDLLLIGVDSTGDMPRPKNPWKWKSLPGMVAGEGLEPPTPGL